MKKRLLVIISLALVMCMALSGCMYVSSTVTINDDGSGTSSVISGPSMLFYEQMKAWNDEIQEGEEGSGQYDTSYYESGLESGDIQVLDKNGQQYLVEESEHKSYGADELIETRFDGALSDSAYIIRLEDGFRLFLTEEMISSVEQERNDQADVMVDEIQLSDDMLQGLEEYMEQDTPYMELNFEFPYPVYQVGGGSDGVYVDGKRVTIVTMELKRGSGTLIFDSRKVHNTAPVVTTDGLYGKRVNDGWGVDPLDANWSKGGKTGVFSDVKNVDWYYEAVMKCYQGKSVMGNAGKFKPTDDITVAEFFTILSRVSAAYLDEVQEGEVWYAPVIRWVQEDGLYEGDAKADANRPITRQQAVYGIMSLRDDLVGSFDMDKVNDVDQIDEDFLPMLEHAYAAGIVHGDSAGNFNAGNGLSRAETCQILYNMGWYDVPDVIQVTVD